MRKQLIRKHQDRSTITQTTDFFNKTLKPSKMGFDVQPMKGIGTLPGLNIGTQGLSNIAPESTFNIGSVGGAIGGAVGKYGESAINMLGGKQADSISTGEGMFSAGTDLALQAATKSGNPFAIAGAGVLKGLDLLNRYGGKTSKKQGTIGLDTGAYASQINPMAGKKRTLLGSIFGKNKRDNKLTSYYDKQNLKAGAATYQNNQENLAAQNSIFDTGSRNQQSLQGGLNTNILAAKKGTKLSKVEIRTITEKVTKFQKGGKMNVIPEGALHARKHNIELDGITNKGIPVVTKEDGGQITQQAEIERDEIIFTKSVTDELEKFHEQYKNASDDEKRNIAIECGKYLSSQILDNTIDNTGILNNG